MVRLTRNRLSRATALLSIGVAAAAVLLLAVTFKAGGYSWTVETVTEVIDPGASIRQRLKSSSLAGWWRCLGTARPILATGAGDVDAWSIKYAWTERPEGRLVELTVESNGLARMRFTWQDETETHQVQIPVEDIRRVAQVVDASRVFCLTTKDRVDHQIVPLGTYELSVTTGGKVWTVQAGQCHYVDDPEAFGSVREVIRGLDSQFGIEFDDSPPGVMKLYRPCETS